MKRAILIGATGLVGTSLLNKLLENPSFSSVLVFTRRPTLVNHPKLKEYLVDFDTIEDWCHLIEGDVLFACLGTTIKKAGSKEIQFKIDYQYTYDFVRLGIKNGLQQIVLISSIGANSKSRNFYLRTKGQLENDLIAFHPTKLQIYRPSILDGDRKEFRFGEKISIPLMRLLSFLPFLSKYRPTKIDLFTSIILKNSNNQKINIQVFEGKDCN
jgi:uncharacterized protein YbjT (DUF2867 family)